MQTQDEQRDEEWNDIFYDVSHKTEITLCSVMANGLGEVLYEIHVADPKNLQGPVGFVITVHPDGALEFTQKSPEETAEMILTEEELDHKHDEEHRQQLGMTEKEYQASQ